MAQIIWSVFKAGYRDRVGTIQCPDNSSIAMVLARKKFGNRVVGVGTKMSHHVHPEYLPHAEDETRSSYIPTYPSRPVKLDEVA